MATIATNVFATGTTAEQIKSYFEALDNRITCTISSTTIAVNIADAITWTFNVESNYWRNPFTFTINGTTSGNVGNPAGTKTCISIVDTDFIYIHLTDEYTRRTCILYCTDGTNSYAGYISSGSSEQSYLNISNMSLQKIGDTSLTYTITPMLNYATEAGYIDIVPFAILTNGGIKVATLDYFKACSTITIASTVTVGGSNYYAIGTNVLTDISGG